MDQRPPDERRPDDPSGAPPDPEPTPPPDAPPPEPPRSTIISADPAVSADPASAARPAPEVAWAPPPRANERPVPGAPGLVFAGIGQRFLAWVIDGVIVIFASVILSVVLSAALDLDTTRDSATTGFLFSVFYTGLSALYFVGLWMSPGRATLGMRALKLQVGTAFQGDTLSIGQAATRWALLGYPLGLVLYLPALAGLVSLVAFVWPIVLLVSTASSQTRQGIHDQVARSAVVAPAGAGGGGLAMACLVIVIVLVAVAVASIVALIFLGSQISSILEEMGNSVR